MALWKFCLTVFFIHPEEDRQVGRNIGVLQKRVSSSFVFSILFYEETIHTYWMLVKDFIYIYIYIYTADSTAVVCVKTRTSEVRAREGF